MGTHRINFCFEVIWIVLGEEDGGMEEGERGTTNFLPGNII